MPHLVILLAVTDISVSTFFMNIIPNTVYNLNNTKSLSHSGCSDIYLKNKIIERREQSRPIRRRYYRRGKAGGFKKGR